VAPWTFCNRSQTLNKSAKRKVSDLFAKPVEDVMESERRRADCKTRIRTALAIVAGESQCTSFLGNRRT
jgi:hypothetical protein